VTGLRCSQMVSQWLQRESSDWDLAWIGISSDNAETWDYLSPIVLDGLYLGR
jgi:hypothetical protein